MNALQVYDSSGKAKDKDTITLDLGLTKKEVSPKAYSCAVKVLRQNGRQGTVSCKGRGEIAFSKKKPWKQKGTGRARVGTKSSPIWRSGGVTFGPQPRTRRLSMPKKQRSLVFNNVFHMMLENDSVKCLDLEIKKPSVKTASAAIKGMGLGDKKIAVFVDRADTSSALSFRNMANVNAFYFDEPNAINLTHCDYWVVLKKDMNHFKDMVSKWN